MPPDPALVRAWCDKAESDLRNITNNLQADPHNCPYDTVCYHAQQAAEKYLKALLTFLAVPFPKVHDLAALVSLLPPELAQAARFGDLTGLSYYANVTRYPGTLDEFTRDDAVQAEAQAIQVKKIVLALLLERGYR